MGSIRYIDHTADAGVEIKAASREELFVLGARALYQLVMDYDAVRPVTELRLSFSAPGLADLFHEWLAELIYRLDVEGIAFKRFGFEFIGDTRLEAVAAGECVDYERHGLHGEVKNVTYCDFSVREDEDGALTARAIFDL